MTRRIGVNVSTGTRSGPNNQGAPSGVLHLVGLTEMGPTGTAISVPSFTNYQDVFGARTSYASPLFDSARTFFEEGGAELLVSRAVGPDASSATVDLTTPTTGEGEDETGGDAVMRIGARHQGGFANGFTVTVSAEGDNGYTIRILDHEGDGIALWADINSVEELVTRAENNSMFSVDSLAESDGETLDLATGEFEMTGGMDDRDNITTETLIDTLDDSDDEGEGGAVAAPGYPADVIGHELLDYAKRSRKIAILATRRESTVAEAGQIGEELAANTDGDYGGLFYPHVTIPDGSGSRTISPEGYVGAVRARAFASGEFWQIPAGQRARARWITGTSAQVNSEALDRLDESYVNGIKINGGIYLNNWSSLSRDRENFDLLRNRDVLNNLKVMVRRALEPHVWSTIDGRGQLMGQVEGEIVGILAPIADAGGFFAELNDAGEEVNPGYRVVVDQTNNSLNSLARNELFADVSVKLSPVAKRINVEIVKVPVNAAL